MDLLIKPANEAVERLYTTHLEEYYNDPDPDAEPENEGFDLFFPEDVVVPAGALAFEIDLQVSIEMIDSARGKNVGYFLVPRSSITKTPLRLANSMGIIDRGYRGTIRVRVDNMLRCKLFVRPWGGRSEEMDENDFVVRAGTRLFQLIAPGMQDIHPRIEYNLSTTKRGEGGFGSTGGDGAVDAA